MSALCIGKKASKRQCYCHVEKSKSSPDLTLAQRSSCFGESVEDDEVSLLDSDNAERFHVLCQTDISVGRPNEGVLLLDCTDDETIVDNFSNTSHFSLNSDTKIWEENFHNESSYEEESCLKNEDETLPSKNLSTEVPDLKDLSKSEALSFCASNEISRVNKKLIDYELHKAKKFNNLNAKGEESSISNPSSNAYMIESLTPSELGPSDIFPSESTVNLIKLNGRPSQSEIELKVTNFEEISSENCLIIKELNQNVIESKSNSQISVTNNDSKLEIVQEMEPSKNLNLTTNNEMILKPKPTKLKIQIGDAKIKICTNEPISMKGLAGCENFVIPPADDTSQQPKAIISAFDRSKVVSRCECGKEIESPKTYTKIQIRTSKKPPKADLDKFSEKPYKILCQVSPKNVTNTSTNRRTKICIIPRETTINLMPRSLVSTPCQTEVLPKEVVSQRVISTVENTLSTYENEIQPLRHALAALQSKIRSLHITDLPSTTFSKPGFTNYSNSFTKSILPPVSPDLPKTFSYTSLNSMSHGCNFHDQHIPYQGNSFQQSMKAEYSFPERQKSFIDCKSLKSKTQTLLSGSGRSGRKSKCKSNDLPGLIPLKTDPNDFFNRSNILY